MTAPTPAPSAYGGPAAQDPGKTLGIVGLVLAFFIPIVGLIVSLIARAKSKGVGLKNSLATAGVVVSIAMMLIVGLAIALPIIGVVNKCKELGPGTHHEGGTTYSCS